MPCGFRWRFTRFTPCTRARSSLGFTAMTSPRLPLSRPASTWTRSPFLIFAAMALQDLRRQRDDLHVLLRPQLAHHRAEDAGADRLARLVDQHRGVVVEADRRAVCAPHRIGGADDDGAMHLALLDLGARDRLLDRDDDHVADAGR